MKNEKMTLTEQDLQYLVTEATKRVISEGFEDGSSLETVVMKLYNFGAKLNIGKEYQNISIRGVGSIIMECCRKIMELYKNKDMRTEFSSEFSKIANKNGGA